MRDETFDVAIIGAGTAGLAALREVRRRAAGRFVIINDGPYGTTCARVGCMPSKALIEAANAFHRRHAFEAFGIRAAERLSIDIPAVLRHVRALRDSFVKGTVRVTAELGEHSIAGRARLLGPDRIEVGGRCLRARKIVIATGSRPIVPHAWRELGDRVLDTDSFFEREDLPARIGVIGMGAIGAELAQALSRLGLEVKGFGTGAFVGGLSDPLVNESLLAALRSEFAVHLGPPAELSRDGDGLRVRSADHEARVDCVLAALGRRPNIDDMGLEALGVELDERGMPPLDLLSMRIADLPVFLAGDANGHAPLLHEAADDGHIAGVVASEDIARIFRRRTALSIVFCEPNVATVGKRFKELDPETSVIGEVDFERQGRARIAQRNRGLIRIYAARDNAVLLGAEICAPAGEHLAHLLALAIDRSLTVHDLLRMPIYHPVLEEGMRTALRQIAAQVPQCNDSDLAACAAIGATALD
jgi:dihydrolipoamide dehydrogenase